MTNLFETLDFLTKELSRGNDVDEILLDFSKAFYLVPHNRIIHQLRVRFSEDLVDWIKDNASMMNSICQWFEDWMMKLNGRMIQLTYRQREF